MTSAMPVLISGGGPSGLSTALELALHGVECVVIEPRLVVVDDRPRAKTTNARTMELFRRWGVSTQVREAAPLSIAYSTRVTFCTTVTGDEVTHFDGVFGLDLADSDVAAEPGQQVTQPVIERVLRAAVDAAPTTQLRLGARVAGLDERSDGVLVRVQTADGGVEEILAQHVVGADGPRSVVRKALGARYEGGEAGRPNVNISFRSRELGERIPHHRSVQYWVLNPASPGVVGPLDGRDLWWAISTGTAAITDGDHAVRIVRDLVGTDIDIEVLATDPWQAKMLLADSYGNRRLHLVGDAAHQNPPWGGHGFNTGVGDAVNLGWKLAAAVQGWAPPALLDSYGAERRPIAQSVIDVAATNMATLSIDLTDPALMGTGPEAEAARARAAAVVQRTKDAEFHSHGLVLGSGYTQAAREQAPDVGTYLPRLVAGARLVHRRLSDGRSVYDLLGPGFTLFEEEAGAGEQLSAEAVRRGVPLQRVDGIGDGSWPVTVLVRPDQVVAYAGPAPVGAAAAAVVDEALSGFPAPGSDDGSSATGDSSPSTVRT